MKDITNQRMSVNNAIKSVKTYKIEPVNPFISTLLTDVKSLGEITTVPVRLKINENDVPRTQIQIETMKPTFLRCFKIKHKDATLTRCTLSNDGKIYITDFTTSKKLLEYNFEGKCIKEVVTRAAPFDVVAMHYGLIAVTYGMKQYLEIIDDARNNTMDRKVRFSQSCWGISYQNENLYVALDSVGVIELDTLGRSLRVVEKKHK